MRRRTIFLGIFFIVLFLCVEVFLNVEKRELTNPVGALSGVSTINDEQEDSAIASSQGIQAHEEESLSVDVESPNEVASEETSVNAAPNEAASAEASVNEVPIEELDFLHSMERKVAAEPYENKILPEFIKTYYHNKRLIGWIRMDGTDIDCPVLQSIENYDFYLTHDLDDNESEQGCIILDPDSEIGIGTKETGYLEGYEPSTNQLVHGHNMKSGTMFGALDYYAKESFANAHPYIYFDSLYEHRTYEVLLAFYSKVYPEDENVFKYYNFNQANTPKEFDDWLSEIQALAIYERDVQVAYGDEMITLSTCAYQEENGRFAVVGRRVQ